MRKPFLVCWKKLLIILHKYPKKLYISKTGYYCNSCFAKLRAISNLFSFFYTPCRCLIIKNKQVSMQMNISEKKRNGSSYRRRFVHKGGCCSRFVRTPFNNLGFFIRRISVASNAIQTIDRRLMRFIISIEA